MEKEIWKPIKNYEGFYEVSSHGKIKSCDRVIIYKSGLNRPVKERIRKPGFSGRGNNRYRAVILSKDGINKLFRVHRLVAEAFIKNEFNKPCVNHKDGDKFNNNVNNLEWVTNSENMKHAFENNLINVKNGEESYQSKLTKNDVHFIRRNSQNITQKNMAHMFGVDQSTISRIVTVDNWKHLK